VDLGKAYRRYPTRWSRLIEWVVPFTGVRHQLIWVLRDINFTVEPGEAVGIIGINGAGKSTLLKLITGTARPTTGEVYLSGRVSALLELGMGFHPEFTGRQNVFMSAQLMGMPPEAIHAALPDIEAFAEIGAYFDQPVRVYSSGMQVRLAFAVATAWRPDVLIVDEALSVGDAYFQHKSFDRIRAFREQGTTLLIVSHDKAAIQNLCDRAILLDGGRIAREGEPEAIMDFYNALIAEYGNQTVRQEKLDNGRTQTVSGTGEARVTEIGLYNDRGEPVECVGVGEPVELHVKVKVHRPIETLVLGYGIKDRLGQVMYGTNTWHTGQVIRHPRSGAEYLFRIAFPANLGVGSYSVVTALHERDTHLTANYEWRDLALVFNVVNKDKCIFTGCQWNEPEITIEPTTGTTEHHSSPAAAEYGT
jgi:lipopolysaccharide transport system ATP-binding protein